MDDLNECSGCGNIGYRDSWPFVMLREPLVESDGPAEMLCRDCWEAYEKECHFETAVEAASQE